MTFTITITGSGNSAGVPTIGNYWGACDPNEPKNKRMRASALVQSAQTALWIDTGPDFKHQFNRTELETLDAVLCTHAHSDHIQGIDDLRIMAIRGKKQIDMHAMPETLNELKARFGYLFEQQHKLYPQVINPIEIADYGSGMTIGDISFVPFIQDHGMCSSLGFRFGDLAYSIDMVNLDDTAINVLKGIKIWVVDAAGYKMERNIVHATLQNIYDLNERIGAPEVWITNLTPAMDYKALCDELPDGYMPAYDGLKINISQ